MPGARASAPVSHALFFPFSKQLVFSRALSRALEARLDQQLRAGAHAFAVGELRFSRRAVRAHPFELAARFGWADWQPRPLYHYVFEGDVTPPPAAGDEG